MVLASENLRSISPLAESLSLASRKSAERSPEERLQDTFSAVLSQVGREGYQSATAIESDSNLNEGVVSSWEDWFDSIAPSRYSFMFGPDSPSVQEGSSPDSLKQEFGKIISDAYRNGGYATPQKYLQSLSPDQLATIQQVQHLADPIRVEQLTDESSLNLLLPPDTQVDSNHDGLTAVGAAYTLRFPDSNTPENVRRAWEQATENLSEADRMTYVLQMTLPITLANIHTDSSGAYTGSSDPGDPDWMNPMANSDYSYRDSANGWLDYLDRFKNQIPLEQYERDLRFWSTFRDSLEKIG